MTLKRTFEQLPQGQRNIVSAIASWVLPPCDFTTLLYLEDDGWIQVVNHDPGWALTPEGEATYTKLLDADIERSRGSNH